MADQQEMWNQKHAAHQHAAMEGKPNTFAQAIAPNIAPGQRLLELGCGVGSDARYFASLGAEVVATDFSEEVIRQDNTKPSAENLVFSVMDITQPFPHPDSSFDAVYAHLSLHYYDELTTQKIFAEIARVLKTGGMLYFSCKSIHDPKYGEGEEVQPDIFDRGGHIRHFFSLDYARQLLGAYMVVKLEETEGVYSDGQSAFIQCWAKKKLKTV